MNTTNCADHARGYGLKFLWPCTISFLKLPWGLPRTKTVAIITSYSQAIHKLFTSYSQTIHKLHEYTDGLYVRGHFLPICCWKPYESQLTTMTHYDILWHDKSSTRTLKEGNINKHKGGLNEFIAALKGHDLYLSSRKHSNTLCIKKRSI